MKIANLSDNTLLNSVCKMPASQIKMSVKQAKYSLIISATLLGGFLPFPAIAQLSKETLNSSSELQEIATQQLPKEDEETIKVSQERLELLSEQDRLAQEQLSKENEETAKQFILTPELTSIDDQKILQPIDNDKVLQPQAITTYSANPQVPPNRCTSSVFENYGCYAIQLQGGRPFTPTASPLSAPSAFALNAQEADRLLFPNGDPPGTWLETQYPFVINSQPKRAFNEFAIGAAKAMYDWRSPVFFQADFGSGGFENAVLESVSFNSPFTNVLSTLCPNSGFNTRGANVSTVAAQCAISSGINGFNPSTFVSSIDIAYWPRSGSSQSRIDRTYTGSSLDSFIVNNFNKASSRTYVWDPPQTAEKVPEPSSALALLTFGLFSAGYAARRKHK